MKPDMSKSWRVLTRPATHLGSTETTESLPMAPQLCPRRSKIHELSSFQSLQDTSENIMMNSVPSRLYGTSGAARLAPSHTHTHQLKSGPTGRSRVLPLTDHIRTMILEIHPVLLFGLLLIVIDLAHLFSSKSEHLVPWAPHSCLLLEWSLTSLVVSTLSRPRDKSRWSFDGLLPLDQSTVTAKKSMTLPERLLGSYGVLSLLQVSTVNLRSSTNEHPRHARHLSFRVKAATMRRWCTAHPPLRQVTLQQATLQQATLQQATRHQAILLHVALLSVLSSRLSTVTTVSETILPSLPSNLVVNTTRFETRVRRSVSHSTSSAPLLCGPSRLPDRRSCGCRAFAPKRFTTTTYRPCLRLGRTAYGPWLHRLLHSKGSTGGSGQSTRLGLSTSLAPHTESRFEVRMTV